MTRQSLSPQTRDSKLLYDFPLKVQQYKPVQFEFLAQLMNVDVESFLYFSRMGALSVSIQEMFAF